jgi:hypothetical protein
MHIGKLEARHRLTVVRRLCGHDSAGPRAVADQFIDLIRRPISPPPARNPSPSFLRSSFNCFIVVRLSVVPTSSRLYISEGPCD